MKKFLSALLALCMILSVCFVLASCNKTDNDGDGDGDDKGPGNTTGTAISADELKNNTMAALVIIENNTTNQFFGDPDGSAAVLESAVNGGSVQLVFETDRLLGDITEISETIYMNGKDAEFVSDTAVRYNGDVLGGRIFINKDGLMLNSSDILGSDKTLAVNIDSFFEKFTTSALAELIFGGETPAEFEDALAQIKDMLDNFKMPAVELDPSVMDELQAIYTDLNMTVTEENVDGTDCFVVTFTITNDNFKTIYTKLMDIVFEVSGDMLKEMADSFGDYMEVTPEEVLDQMKAELDASMEEMFAEMDENVDIEVSVKLNINKATSAYTSIVIDGVFANPNAEEGDSINETGIMSRIDVDGKITFASDKIAFKLDALADGEDDNSLGADFEITKSEENGVRTFKATAGAYFNDAGESVFNSKVLDASFTYNKESGEYSFAAEVGTDVDDGETIVFIIDGKYKADDDSVSFEINSVTMDDITVKFRFAVIINAKADMPEAPADAMDIVELTEDEIIEIMEEIQNSPLVELINSLMPEGDTSVEPEYGYNDGYAA